MSRREANEREEERASPQIQHLRQKRATELPRRVCLARFASLASRRSYLPENFTITSESAAVTSRLGTRGWFKNSSRRVKPTRDWVVALMPSLMALKGSWMILNMDSAMKVSPRGGSSLCTR